MRHGEQQGNLAPMIDGGGHKREPGIIYTPLKVGTKGTEDEIIYNYLL
jgi:hypothetical protein